MDEHQVFASLGEAGFSQLCAAFYRRVRRDDLVGRMYPPDDWDGAEQRLRDFLIFRFGGSTRYIEQRGHPRLRMRHRPYVINRQARDRWVSLMGAALDELKLPANEEAYLRGFFSDMASFLQNSAD